MGSDKENLFHKRKAQNLERKKPSKKPYEKILIVCEGEKTEPYYFEELKDHYEIDTANIRISGECGSDPISVVRHGQDLYREELKKTEPFDKVFCVFDRDNYGEKFYEAVRLTESLKPNNVFQAITSIPCFEVWFILHFDYFSTAFETVGKKTCGMRTVSELEKYWPEYKKGCNGSFDHVFENIERAKALSLRLHNDSKRSGSTNPLTNVHILVEYLQKVKG